ncbi:sensor histidine kinase, partial [Vibrio sp. 10N.261.45.F1]
ISIIEAFRSSNYQPQVNDANQPNNIQPNRVQKELTANRLFKLGPFNLYPATFSNNQYQVVALKKAEAELIKV